MSKLIKINRILFTVMAVIIIIFIIILTLQLLEDKFNTRSNYDFPDTSIVSEEKAKQQIKDNLRENIISVNSIVLIDTLKSLYYVPVSQLHLKTPEEAVQTRQFGAAMMQVPDYSYYESSSNYNNIVLLNLKAGSANILFNKRVCIIEDELYTYNNEKYLLLILSDADTNKDGILDRKDLLGIYIYDIKNNALKCITNSPLHILKLIKPTPFIDALFGKENRETDHSFFIKIGLDKNNDGVYNRNEEPELIKRLDIEKYTINDILDNTIINELQTILDSK